MNERIREFAEQTGYIWHASGDPQVYEFTPEKLDEFAELIVRKCAELSVNSQYVNTKSEYYEGFNEALVYAGNKIKKHFGVEE